MASFQGLTKGLSRGLGPLLQHLQQKENVREQRRAQLEQTAISLGIDPIMNTQVDATDAEGNTIVPADPTMTAPLTNSQLKRRSANEVNRRTTLSEASQAAGFDLDKRRTTLSEASQAAGFDLDKIRVETARTRAETADRNSRKIADAPPTPGEIAKVDFLKNSVKKDDNMLIAERLTNGDLNRLLQEPDLMREYTSQVANVKFQADARERAIAREADKGKLADNIILNMAADKSSVGKAIESDKVVRELRDSVRDADTALGTPTEVGKLKEIENILDDMETIKAGLKPFQRDLLGPGFLTSNLTVLMSEFELTSGHPLVKLHTELNAALEFFTAPQRLELSGTAVSAQEFENSRKQFAADSKSVSTIRQLVKAQARNIQVTKEKNLQAISDIETAFRAGTIPDMKTLEHLGLSEEDLTRIKDAAVGRINQTAGSKILEAFKAARNK